jgi:protein TonB
MVFFGGQECPPLHAAGHTFVAGGGFDPLGASLQLAQEDSMFETSLVIAQPRAARRAGLLTVSLVAHTAAIVGAVALSVASTNFPKEAPQESARFMPVAPPPPLGNPNGGAPPRPGAAPPVQRQEPPPPPNQITAPPIVPDDVPVVEGPTSGDVTTTGPGTGTVEGPVGVPWGDPNGVGDPDAPPSTGPVTPVDETIYTPGVGGVVAPVLIQRVDPLYPERLRPTAMSATVVVRCVIDKNGLVRDPQVVVGSMPPFNDAVLKAVKQWRYRPGSLRGTAVETFLELKVHFSITR